MGDEFWNQLRIQTETEVKKKIRDFRNFSHDLIDESVAEVIQNVYGHYVSGKFTNQDQLCRHAENHIINAIRKIKRLYYRDRNVLEFIKDDIKLYDLGLPIETIALEGIRHLSGLADFAPRSGGQFPKSFRMESSKEFGSFPDRPISLHFLIVDAMHAIDAQSVEQYSLVKVFLDVSYWSGLLLG